ncbi:hypothetical protein QQS21_005338 [Conoideocrella luteorostrata]|uniref:Uncharacterized protein n=1 Tax=Conoideocrella luteorostrata TaxID=1105319 RepID=A0AAJ0FUL0_9HYPO|nr:hypothetical protein QQS21_005338 [Conoideocrella luteorostrata]
MGRSASPAEAPPRKLQKARSLGTTTIIQAPRADKRYDSDSTYDDDIKMNVPRPAREAFQPSFPPPPPTATTREKRARIRPPPRPIERVPPLPPLPAVVPPPKSPVGLGLLNPQPVAKPKRKTILEQINGWWDLGLLEKRQTLFGKHH